MAKNLKDIVFTSALRTAIGKFKGLWRKSQAHDLGKSCYFKYFTTSQKLNQSLLMKLLWDKF